MTVLLGGDSATPKPDKYEGHKIWGVYVGGHPFQIWTREDVAQLASHGVEGVMPIVVPPQDDAWWELNHGYALLHSLVREAKTWGVPEGAPLCLDIEEAQAEKIGAFANDVAHAWAVACQVDKFRPWVYGSKTFLSFDHYSNRWLAEWPEETPERVLPEGFQGWQYKGNDDGIDLDIFEEGRVFMSPDLKLVKPTTAAIKAKVEESSSPVEPSPTQENTGETVGDDEPSSESTDVIYPRDETAPMTETPPQVLSDESPSGASVAAPAEGETQVDSTQPADSTSNSADVANASVSSELKSVVSELLDLQNRHVGVTNYLISLINALDGPVVESLPAESGETNDEVPKS